MRDHPLYFMDYIFQLNVNNDIQFDRELNLEHFDMKEGDMLQVKMVNGTVVLERK